MFTTLWVTLSRTEDISSGLSPGTQKDNPNRLTLQI